MAVEDDGFGFTLPAPTRRGERRPHGFELAPVLTAVGPGFQATPAAGAGRIGWIVAGRRSRPERLAPLSSPNVTVDESTYERDAELVGATLAGARNAFGELVAHYQQRVFAVAYRYVGNEADASDLSQRAFLRAFERLATLKRRESFVAWLLQMTANLAKNALRDRASKPFTEIQDTVAAGEPSSEKAALRREQRESMRAALRRLPDRQQRCVLLRIDGELSFREIGEMVGCSEASARVNFHHGLRRLRQLVNQITTPAPTRSVGQDTT